MKLLLQFAFLLLLCSTLAAQKLTLVKKGRSAYSIVIPEKATLTEIQSAKVLQDYLFRITGVNLPVVADNGKSTASEILIGRVNRPEQDQVDYGELKQDGLLIKTDRDKLILTGGNEKGVIYSVYTFLENYLGCRKYTSDFTYVPTRKTIKLQPVNDMQLPAFSFRETY
ncbi:MAG TPA: alpha-glucuronidase family glycosyl hydrolase, partial [Agriterribacter sp.]|nr:alpha-glucuronidase family glycosyl hydrolase [Agriterribacter sp.]